MRSIREFIDEGGAKHTVYEIDTTPHCDKGHHTMGPDGMHCRDCGIDVLKYLGSLRKEEINNNVSDKGPRKGGTLDDFLTF